MTAAVLLTVWGLGMAVCIEAGVGNLLEAARTLKRFHHVE